MIADPIAEGRLTNADDRRPASSNLLCAGEHCPLVPQVVAHVHGRERRQRATATIGRSQPDSPQRRHALPQTPPGVPDSAASNGPAGGQVGPYPAIAVFCHALIAETAWPAGDCPKRQVTQPCFLDRSVQHNSVVAGPVGVNDERIPSGPIAVASNNRHRAMSHRVCRCGGPAKRLNYSGPCEAGLLTGAIARFVQ